ncbi:MAG: site-specific integrase [Vagococcus sp.]|jgi:integrase/recombinase XerC|nr:site-specific integrase [Vagococcus sp.]
MAKVVKVKYFTQDKLDMISERNKKYYDKYLQSNIIKNRDVKDTTYKTYKNYFMHWLAFIAEKYDNIDIYSEEFQENAVDIMEAYIAFCQDVLLNHKKVINTKLSTVSTFYIWSMKRGFVKAHPFDKKLDRMKGSQDEKIINSYYLTPEQIQKIRLELSTNDKFSIQEQILFEIAYDSANRIGALEKLTISSLDIDNMLFRDIREKRGYLVEVIFEEHAKDLIEEWLEMRKYDYDHLECDALFITKRDGKYNPMSRTAIHDRMRKFGKVIGIDDFRAHCVRKSKLNNVYEETGDLTLAAELGNHKSTETTRQAYIKPKSKSEVRDKINELRRKNDNSDGSNN